MKRSTLAVRIWRSIFEVQTKVWKPEDLSSADASSVSQQNEIFDNSSDLLLHVFIYTKHIIYDASIEAAGRNNRTESYNIRLANRCPIDRWPNSGPPIATDRCSARTVLSSRARSVIVGRCSAV